MLDILYVSLYKLVPYLANFMTSVHLEFILCLKGHSYKKKCAKKILRPTLPVPGSFKCMFCKYFELDTFRFCEMLQSYCQVLMQTYRTLLCDNK